MTTATHYENANFLHELATDLPQLRPRCDISKVELLQRLADEGLAQGQYDERVHAKVAAARTDKRPGLSTEQLRQELQARYDALRGAARDALEPCANKTA